MGLGKNGLRKKICRCIQWYGIRSFVQAKLCADTQMLFYRFAEFGECLFTQMCKHVNAQSRTAALD
jgi:hypothetical protein